MTDEAERCLSTTGLVQQAKHLGERLHDSHSHRSQ
jgi:hypothetical protein